FNIHVCVNGREMLGRQMDQAKIAYQRRDNCFTRVSDVTGAQQLLDAQLGLNWPALLDQLADRVHPARHNMLKDWVPEYYWSAQESEWASDVMFKDQAALASLYPRLIRHGMIDLHSGDVMRYLGKRVESNDRRFTGEVISDIKERGEGL